MALQDKEKEAIIFYLGWPAKTLVVDSTHYSKIISDRMTNLAEVTEKQIRVILGKLELVDKQLDDARCRLQAMQVSDVRMDAEKEIRVLKQERNRCIRELSSYLDIGIVSRGGTMGSVCV